MKTKVIVRAFLTAFLVSILFCFPSLAAEKGITSIDITGVLRTDGSCDITEVWEIDDVYLGTEYFIGLHNLEDMNITHLTVTDDSGTVYQTLDEWDVYASFEEKAYKCGLLQKNNGFEICWGISQMGNRTYTVSYRLNNLVKEYTDQAGFYHRFVSDYLSSSPQSIQITLSMEGTELTEDNTQIWAFGCQGKFQLADGIVSVWSESKLYSYDYVNLLVGFPNVLFDAKLADGTFEDIKEKALHKGEKPSSEAENPEQAAEEPVHRGENPFGIRFFTIIAITILAIVGTYKFITRNVHLANGRKVKRVSTRKVEATSTIPFQSSIPFICAAIKLEGVNRIPTKPIAAYIILWQLDEVIQIENKKGKTVIRFLRIPDGDEIELNLYFMLRDASDGEFLKLRDWKIWTILNRNRRVSWQEDFEAYGKSGLVDRGWARKNDNYRVCFTPNGYDKHIKMLGFYKYLRSFKKRTLDMTAARENWGYYLVFATLFNLTKPVVRGLQKIDGEGFDSFCKEYQMSPAMFIHYLDGVITTSRSLSQSFSRSLVDSSDPDSYDGGSGDISNSGGGGFTGGGGGGSR